MTSRDANSASGTSQVRGEERGIKPVLPLPHLASDRLQALVGGLTRILDTASYGIALIDPPEVFYMSTTCKKLLSELSAVPKSAPPANGGDFTRIDSDLFPKDLLELINSRDREHPTNSTLVNPSRNLLVFVEIRPLEIGVGLPSIPNGLTLLLRRADQAVQIDERLLQTACELTASEARICTLIANGVSVGRISKQLRIHPSTTRTHLKRVYRKTRSTRQAELVRFLMNTARIG